MSAASAATRSTTDSATATVPNVPMRLCPAPEAVGGVGEAVLVQRPRQNDCRSHGQTCGDQCRQSQHDRQDDHKPAGRPHRRADQRKHLRGLPEAERLVGPSAERGRRDAGQKGERRAEIGDQLFALLPKRFVVGHSASRPVLSKSAGGSL
jgi:hypothetical protein